jgi:DNA-binding response OmpR family regulator
MGAGLDQRYARRREKKGTVMGQDALLTRTALVVEDDDVIAHLVQFILQREGYVVRRAADAHAAQALIENEPPCSVVTLDFMLPDASGLDLLALLRRTPGWAHVPVLMLTGGDDAIDSERARDSGAAAYMHKPFDAVELRACIRRIGSPHETAAAA